MQGNVMNKQRAEIEDLAHRITDLYCEKKDKEAKELIPALRQLLREAQASESSPYYNYYLTLVNEVDGNMDEAIRLADLDIERRRNEIERGDYNDYPKLLKEQIVQFQDVLFLQAEREFNIDETASAIARLEESFSIAERYGLPEDEDSRNLYEKLVSDLVSDD
jgi:hypothetical protein